MLRSNLPLRAPALLQALSAVLAHHDAVRWRFVETPGGWRGGVAEGRVQAEALRRVGGGGRRRADGVPVGDWAVGVQLRHEGTAVAGQWRADPAACDDQERCLNQALARDAAQATANSSAARTRKV
ncbi:hypothetical protein B1218_34085, partial [Pseudomonas ogarae]